MQELGDDLLEPAPSFRVALFACLGLQHTRILSLEVVPFKGDRSVPSLVHPASILPLP